MIGRLRRLPRTLLVAVAATCTAMLLAGCSGFGTPDGYVVKAQVPRTFNLFPGSPVMVLGVDVGIIEGLDFEEGSDQVIATMRIDPEVQLPEDVRPVVLTDALLGERFIQLTPAYAGGPPLDPGVTLEEPASTPAEFDELLTALQDFISGIQDGDLPRLVDNLAEVLEGNGENLGRTLEATRDALGVLRDQDQDLIRLASKLSGVNETLNQRREELGTVVQDFAELSQVLSDQRVPLDRALSSLARLADETGRLLDTNRELVEEDVEVLTRVGQTAVRNLDQVSGTLLHSAELFRGAERALNRDHRWLPLVNNTDDLVQYTLDTITERLAGGFLCEREGVPTDVCQDLAELVGEVPLDEICVPELISCPEASGDGGDAQPLGDVLVDTLTEGSANLGDTPEEQEGIDRVVDGIVDGLVGSGQSQDASGDDTAEQDSSGGLLGGGS